MLKDVTTITVFLFNTKVLRKFL